MVLSIDKLKPVFVVLSPTFMLIINKTGTLHAYRCLHNVNLSFKEAPGVEWSVAEQNIMLCEACLC
jgi:hypothetical protein